MWLTRMAVGVVAVSMMGSPALAKTTVLSELGEAPLVGRPIQSTAELKQDFRDRAPIFAEAGEKLGMSPREYDRFRVAIETTTPPYVEIPRHLDAMTGYWAGSVHVLKDVLIPKHTYGWEVSIPERGTTLVVYVPNKCGNVSFIRRITPHVAARKIVPAPVANIAPPAPVPVAVAPAAAPAVVAPAAAAPVGSELPIAAVSHGAGLLPYVGAAIIPFIPFFTSGGGGSSSNTPSAAPAPLCP